jgi:hypothetical protein
MNTVLGGLLILISLIEEKVDEDFGIVLHAEVIERNLLVLELDDGVAQYVSIYSFLS